MYNQGRIEPPETVSEGGVSPRAKCPPGHCTLGQNVPPQGKMSPHLSHAVNVIFDMGTEEEEYDVVFHFLRSGQYPAGFSKNEKTQS